jgi:2-polyprenyl-3-methyl-5-hydroxy-6-metoxy-1,4-benzoquinol methylase
MSTDLPDGKRFNHTIKYQRELLATLPEGASTALDLGCGEGLAARTMARAGLTVVGVDSDEPSIERARAQWSEGIEYVVADVLTADLEQADVVYSGALLHHLDIREGLSKMKTLVKPGGVLLIVGAARNTWRDVPREFAASVVDKAFALVKGSWKHGSPTTWPPPHTYPEVERAAIDLLPGCDYRQQLLWRYTIRWTAPVE